MIQMRWLVPSDFSVDWSRRKLQWRERQGGVGVAQAPAGSGLRMAVEEGWTPWQDVPVVVDDTPQQAQLPAPERPQEKPVASGDEAAQDEIEGRQNSQEPKD